MKRIHYAALMIAGVVAITGCDGDANAPNGAVTALLSVAPAGGTADVDPNTTTVTLEFSAAMHQDMYVALHQEDMMGIYGPLVDGTWSWSQDRTRLMFAPDGPLMSEISYTIHIGGGMMDADGDIVDLEEHGPGMGGQWVTQAMIQGCMMQVCGSMMGRGWMHPDNGTFGMSFTFSTR